MASAIASRSIQARNLRQTVCRRIELHVLADGAGRSRRVRVTLAGRYQPHARVIRHIDQVERGFVHEILTAVDSPHVCRGHQREGVLAASYRYAPVGNAATKAFISLECALIWWQSLRTIWTPGVVFVSPRCFPVALRSQTTTMSANR